MSRLAIEDGVPVRKTPVAPWPYFAPDEIEAVTQVLKSGQVNYWTGSLVKKFEQDFAAYFGMKYGIALANGTLALELALIGWGIGEGDEVITTSRTFIASASCIVRVGATPVIADVDRDSQNITAESIEPLITPKTKAIVAVHLAGWPCDMPRIMELAKKYDLKVIEDCAQSHGAKINGRFAGSFGHMSAFSFCQDKIMTTGGEGGILLLNDVGLYEKMWAFKDHGKSYEAVYRKQHPPGFRWLHESFGTNWRLTEMQAAIGLLQLGKLEGWVRKRHQLAQELAKKLSEFSALRIPVPPSDIFHASYKFYVFVESEKLKQGWTRDKIMEAINAEGIPCFSGSCSEIYLEKAFILKHLGPRERLPVAKELGESSLMLMVHPTLDMQYVDDVYEAFKKVLNS